jgi:PAS domain S-box-containing protein
LTTRSGISRTDGARRGFLFAVIAAGGFVVLQAIIMLFVRPVAPQWLIFLALTVGAGWATLRLRDVPASFSISDTFTIATALLFGPAAATLTVVVDSLVMSWRVASGRKTRRQGRLLFNTTAPALAMWIAAHFFFAVAGVAPLSAQPATVREVAVPLALFAALYFVLNTGLVAVAVAHERQAPVQIIWREHFAPLWLTYFGGASLAGVLVLMTVAQVIDLRALMLVLPLVMVLHVAYRTALDRAHERMAHFSEIASYARALRSTADAVVITGDDQRITLLNAAAQALTGWSEHDALGRPVDLVFRTEDRGGASTDGITSTPESTLRECRLFDRHGAERAIEETHATFRNEDGEPSGLIITFRDISERLAINAERNALLEREQRARAAADTASRMKDEFLTILSHELRTPATSVLGWVRMMQTGRMTAAETAYARVALERSARAQAGLIEDLLDMSRIVSRTMRLEPSPTDVQNVIDRAVASVMGDAVSKQVRVRVHHLNTFGRFPADPNRLQQAVTNLLANAVKFTDRGGTVDVRDSADREHIEIEVADTGCGIDPAWLPFIFERFRQGDSSSTRSHGGLGLGLAIASHIVELHGGTLTAGSAGIGRGAQFTIRLHHPGF